MIRGTEVPGVAPAGGYVGKFGSYRSVSVPGPRSATHDDVGPVECASINMDI
jgi:hypothetical protein